MSEPFSALWAAVYPPTTVTDDIAVRKAVLDELDQTLFIEAGAGSGKTTILVARVVALVSSGIPLTAIAAITFTEKAATELRDRIRHELHTVANHPAANAIISARCNEALDEIDSAAIGTLHSFAQRLLGEHPLEAGLPPRLEVLDEISSEVAFEDRWRAWRDELLEDPAMAETIVLALASKVRLDHLRDLASVFQDNWDLVAERIDDSPPAPAPLDIASIVSELREICRERFQSRDPEDLLALRLAHIERWLDRLDGATDDADRIALIDSRPSFAVGNKGQKKNWPDIAGLRQRVVAMSERLVSAVAALQHACLLHLAGGLARFTRDSVESRRVEGRLEFHDLLVFARRLLRDPEHGARVRALARDRYQRLLLDEFQDTDPIQIELAVRLAAPAEAVGIDWRDLTVEPGRLFFVGDPKQSIYRFRRADIELFLEAAERFGPSRPLTANFRSTAPVVGWINHVFGKLIQAERGAQPAYLPLRAVRRGGRKGPHVMTLGNSPHVPADGERISADELRACEVDDVAAVIMDIVGDKKWPVGDEPRDACLGDITVLLPARTALPALERAFEHAGIAFRAVSGSLVYTTPEVRDLLLAARAIDDPTDELALVATLRSRLFGCTDVDLFEFRNTYGGRWNHQAPLPAALPAGHPVGDALAELSDLARKARWIAPSELLDDLMRRRRLMELGLVGSRARDLWRRLRFVVDQARAWSEAGGTSLRAYLEWATRQATEGTRVAEAVLPETDDDAVQVMTIHAAKGLQFPITIVAGLTTEPRARQDGATVLWAGGGCEIKVGPGVKTARYDELAELDEQLGHHERLRLLYVACTRAQDHLVISTHRRVRKNVDVEREKLTLAELVALAGADSTARPFRAPAQRALPLAPADYSTVPFEFGDPEQWAAELARVLATGRRTSTVAATALATFVPDDDPGLAKEPRDLDLPAWNRGRYGTAIGKAVHGVLQTIDLTSGEPLEATAAAQAAAEGVLGREGVVAALVRSALASATVQRAASRRHWREVYVASPIGGVTLEGYVDLLYRDEGGLVVVDFKTDQVSAADLQTRLDHYRLQTAAYAVAIEHTTGETVDRCELLFLKSEGAALVHVIVDLDDAKAEVLARLDAFSVR